MSRKGVLLLALAVLAFAVFATRFFPHPLVSANVSNTCGGFGSGLVIAGLMGRRRGRSS